MEKFIARAKVVAASLVTYLVLAATAVQWIAPHLAELLPEQAEGITAWAARIVAALVAIVAIIQRVTPVPKSQQGLIIDTTAIEVAEDLLPAAATPSQADRLAVLALSLADAAASGDPTRIAGAKSALTAYQRNLKGA